MPARSNIEWKQWGKSDPLYGVSSLDERNKRGRHPWTEEEFYAFGAQTWAEYSQQWESYGLARKSCVEIGCGAGRITRQLARYFDHVDAIDISEEMIKYAKRNVDSGKVSFHITDGQAVPLPDRSQSAAFSTDVFQHFNQLSHAEGYFAELYRVLEPRGSMMVHLPVYAWPDAMNGVFTALYRVWSLLDAAKAEARRLLIAAQIGRPFMFGIKFEVQWLYKYLSALGFQDIQIRYFENSAGEQGTCFRSYVFARKPPS
jgi:ubiquinone/menaquinone biosynthesis C-methylase UbiE